MALSGERSRPTAAFILSLIGGIFVLIGGIYTAAIYAFVGTVFLSFLPGLGGLLIALAIVALLFGLIIIFGAVRLYTHPESAHLWGAIILVLSIFSWVGGGGFVIGFLLALIGGILALVWHPPAPVAQPWGQPPMAAPPMAGAPAGGGAGQRFCSSCGSPNPPGVQFCSKCGAALPA